MKRTTSGIPEPRAKGRGRDPSRYWKLHDIVEGKKLFMLTATPINNRLIDLQHLIELFSRHQTDYFRSAPLGIHSLAGEHFPVKRWKTTWMRS